MSAAARENGHDTDTLTHALELLRDALGATVIAAYPTARVPLPDTGPCARCGVATIRYGPDGSPLCAGCLPPGRAVPSTSQTPLGWCFISCHRAWREQVKRPEPNAGLDRGTAVRLDLGASRSQAYQP